MNTDRPTSDVCPNTETRLKLLKYIAIIVLLTSITSTILLLIPSNKNEIYQNEVLEVIASNIKEYEQLSNDLLELNRYINRDQLQTENRIPNEISIDTKKYGFSKSAIITRIGLPKPGNDIYSKIYNLDSLKSSTITSIKRNARNLEFHDIKVDTFDVVTFELLRCYSPLECNVYHLVFNAESNNGDYLPISSKLYVKTISTYFK